MLNIINIILYRKQSFNNDLTSIYGRKAEEASLGVLAAKISPEKCWICNTFRDLKVYFELFPLDGANGLGSQIQQDTVDTFYLVCDPVSDLV